MKMFISPFTAIFLIFYLRSSLSVSLFTACECNGHSTKCRLVWPSISSLVESAEVFVWSVGTTHGTPLPVLPERIYARPQQPAQPPQGLPASVTIDLSVLFYVEIMFKLVYTWVNHSCRSTSERKHVFFGFAICGVWGVWKAALCLCYGYTMSDGMRTDICPLTALISMACS